ncbi:MAG: type IX secretion system outer membrane channel protein PorV [Sphingobacteriales bacterium]|nr:type IX secretion system outer membrane channel protein PorV [Sphingobacteriales bacterium]
MMKKFIGFKAFLIIIACLFTYGKSIGQNIITLDGRRNVVTTAVPFLMITPDSRSGALGDAGVALTPDANSIHWNPAKLAFVDNPMGLSLSYVPWLKALVPDINLSYLSIYSRIDEMSAFGASLRYFSLGDITFTNDFGEYMGDFRPHELALDGAYARKLSETFSLGLALRFIYSNLASNIPLSNGTQTRPGIAFSGDISTYWQPEPIKVSGKDMDVRLGMNISNVGSKITYTDETDRDFIPINLKIGSYFNYHIDEYNKLGFVFDLNKLLVPTTPVYMVDSFGNPITNPNDGTLVIHRGKNPDVPVIAGMVQSFYDAPDGFKEELREINPAVGFEYWYNNQVAGRVGYFYEHETKGNRQYVTLGLGIKYTVFNLDVSYLIPTNNKYATQTSPLENTVRFSLQFNLNKKN